MEMKPVRLLIDESTELNGNKLYITKDFYEFPEFKEDYTDEEIKAFLSNELSGEVEITFVGETGVNFKWNWNDEDLYFQFATALKIGKQYYELTEMKRNTTKNL